MPSYLIHQLIPPSVIFQIHSAHPKRQQLTLFLNNLVMAVLPSTQGSKEMFQHTDVGDIYL